MIPTRIVYSRRALFGGDYCVLFGLDETANIVLGIPCKPKSVYRWLYNNQPRTDLCRLRKAQKKQGRSKMKTYIVEWSESWRGKIRAETEEEARDLFHEGEVVDKESISTDLDTIVKED